MWGVNVNGHLEHKVPGFLIVLCPDPFGSGDDTIELFTDDGWEKSLLVRQRVPTGSDHDWLDSKQRALSYPTVEEAVEIAIEALKTTLLKK